MKQEDKELLLKDLCARLIYGVRVKVTPVPPKEYKHISFNGKIVNIDIDYIGVLSDNGFVLQQDIIELKPYLFPLSSMTEEQAKELFDIFGLVCSSTEEDYIKINECTGITFFLLRGFDVETHLDKLIDYLNAHHFDYRGLIPKGLAIDATNLNIY